MKRHEWVQHDQNSNVQRSEMFLCEMRENLRIIQMNASQYLILLTTVEI